MIKPLILAALLAAPAATARANTPDSQLYLLVSRELPVYVADVDASQLSQRQLAVIYSILHSDNSGGDKAAMIRSVIGGRFSLRSLFVN